MERGGVGARRLRAEPIGILPPGIFRRWGAWARTEGRVRAPGVWMCRTGMRASSRRPHGRQLARMRAGGRPARHIWPAPGRPRRQRPLRCIVAAPGARLCPNFRGRQCSQVAQGSVFVLTWITRSPFFSLRPGSDVCALIREFRCQTLPARWAFAHILSTGEKVLGRCSGVFFSGFGSRIDKALGAAP